MAGSRALVNGLRRIHGAAVIFDAVPPHRGRPRPELRLSSPVRRGVRPLPPRGVDLRRPCCRAPATSDLNHRVVDPYDTHPPLRERIEADPVDPRRPGPRPRPGRHHAAGGRPPTRRRTSWPTCSARSRSAELEPVRWDERRDERLPADVEEAPQGIRVRPQGDDRPWRSRRWRGTSRTSAPDWLPPPAMNWRDSRRASWRATSSAPCWPWPCASAAGRWTPPPAPP